MDTNPQLGDGAPDAPPQARSLQSPEPRRSTVELVRGIAEDASTLARQQLELAKQELAESAAVAATGGAVLAAAGVAAVFAFGFLLATLAWGLVDAGLPRWVGFGIVALLMLILAAVLGIIGQRRLAQAKLAPERAQEEFKHATNDLVEGARTTADNVRAEAAATAEAMRVSAVRLVTLPSRARGAVTDAAGGARDALTGVGSATSALVKRLRVRLLGRGAGTPPSL